MQSNRKQSCAAAMAALLLLGVGGCRGPAEEPPKPAPQAPPAAEAAAPAVPEALRKALVEVASMAPADAAVVVTFRSPRAVVDGTNEAIGPELSSLIGVPLSLLPAKAFDMEGPVMFALLVKDEPAPVFVMRVKDPSRLEGEPVEVGIHRVKAHKADIYVARMGPWAAFGNLASVKAFKQASAAKLKIDPGMADRVAENLVWVYVNAKPLAALAKPKIQKMKQAAQQRQAGQTPSHEVKALQWVEDLLDQLETAEIGLTANGGRLLARGRLTVAENAPLLAIARAMKPIDTYGGALPQTDRFLAAAWANIDYSQATPQVKAFLRPVVDFALEKLGEAAAARPAGESAVRGVNVMAVLRQAIEEQWALADDYSAALGNRQAVLMEMPERGQPLYRLTETIDLKDTAKYKALLKKSMDSTEKLLKAITGAAAEGKGAPKLEMGLEYKSDAETIEGISVDVMRFKFSVGATEGMPPAAARMFQAYTEALYGREGLVMRTGVCENRALAVTGEPELMVRAIKRQRGQVEDLVKQKAVSEALRRVPKGASMALLVSLPAYACTLDTVFDEAMMAGLPPDRQEAVREIPLPRIAPPSLTEPTVFSLVVDGRAIRLEMDMPASEVAGSIPYFRHAYGRFVFYLFQLMPGLMEPGSPMGMPPGEPPRGGPPPRGMGGMPPLPPVQGAAPSGLRP